MLNRIVFVFALVIAVALVPAVSFAGGGVAVAVPSCQVQSVQAYASVQVAVPVYAPQVVQLQAVQAVQAAQAVKVQQVQFVQGKQHAVRVQVVNQPRTALGAAIQAFRDRRFGR